jgi:D-alanyl-D-alanine carboxypeptidase/D-alanyl-D-alanine-endopeptidase (penicillin-binding protein 4)
VRRFLVPLVFALVFAVAVVGATRSPAIGHATGHDVDGEVATPVLSARRAAVLLSQLGTESALDTQLDALVRLTLPTTCVVVRSHGRDIYVHSPDLPLAPASNEKLLTAFAALHVLGPNYRFNTKVVATTRPDAAGVVHGDVWLVGGGDPLLTTQPYRALLPDPTLASSLESLADALVHAGVRRIDGRLIGNESRYDSLRVVPSWPPHYYTDHNSGPLSALTVNDGYASAGNSFIDAPDPPRSAADDLLALLFQRGVPVAGGTVTGLVPAKTTELAHLESLPLATIIREMLSESDNQTAELLTKELGYSAGAGTTANGVKVIQRTLDAAGISRAGSVQVDGSGLDPNNRATCRLLATVLDAAGPTSPLAQALAIAGQTGTLKGRLVGTPAAGQVHAKTGSLNTVSALSGFATAAGGQTLTFAFIANGVPPAPITATVEDDVAINLVKYPAGVALRGLEPSPPRQIASH